MEVEQAVKMRNAGGVGLTRRRLLWSVTMGRCPGTISKCWPGICHGAVMSKVTLPTKQPALCVFVALEESRRAIPDGRQGIVAVLSRGA